MGRRAPPACMTSRISNIKLCHQERSDIHHTDLRYSTRELLVTSQFHDMSFYFVPQPFLGAGHTPCSDYPAFAVSLTQ